jgi:hypothetical protein
MARPANRSCITDLERDLVVQQTYVPLARLAEAERRLRNGDVFALVTKVPGLDVTHVGLIERTPTGVNGIHAAPERGVMRSVGFTRYAASVPEVVGVAFWRPGPQAEGAADAIKPGN